MKERKRIPWSFHDWQQINKNRQELMSQAPVEEEIKKHGDAAETETHGETADTETQGDTVKTETQGDTVQTETQGDTAQTEAHGGTRKKNTHDNEAATEMIEQQMKH